MAARRRPPWPIAPAREASSHNWCFAGVVLIVLLALTGPLQYLPLCVLAAIVFTIAVDMIDVTSLRDIRRESPGEFDLAVAPRQQLSQSASSKASCWRLLYRSFGMCVTAIGRTRRYSCRRRPADGCRRP